MMVAIRLTSQTSGFPAAVCLAFRQTPPGIQDIYVLWGWARVPNFMILRWLIISRAEAPKARP